jgi:hypothetical protein
MKQWICIEDGKFYAERKVTKGEILWADKFEYENIKNSAMYHIFEESPSHKNGNKYVLGLPTELFEKHFILLTEWREQQLEEILK